MDYNLNLKHLYPSNLNLYGDSGNVKVFKRRCEWHNIDLKIEEIEIGDKIEPNTTDLYFIGGGQDNDQVKIVEDFHKLKYENLKQDIESDVIFLGVCGGYQLIGKSFLMGNGETTKGLNLIDVSTEAPSLEVKTRCIGNLIIKIDDDILAEMKKIYAEPVEIPDTLVGFENHSGQTKLGENVKALGTPISGFGNDISKKTEGARYRNVFGCYMHGSLLPKNPHFADYLIWLALVRKYNDRSIKLNNLDDKIEYTAHESVVERYN